MLLYNHIASAGSLHEKGPVSIVQEVQSLLAFSSCQAHVEPTSVVPLAAKLASIPAVTTLPEAPAQLLTDVPIWVTGSLTSDFVTGRGARSAAGRTLSSRRRRVLDYRLGRKPNG